MVVLCSGVELTQYLGGSCINSRISKRNYVTMEHRIPKRGHIAIEIIQTKKRLASSLRAFLNGNSVIKEIL